MTEAREAIAEANLKASKMDHFMRDYFDVDAFLTALSEAGWVVEQGWQPIETAPKDGTSVRLLVGGKPYQCRWASGYVSADDQMCCCWECDDFAPPPGWSGGTCWEVNDDGVRSPQPTHWRPLPTPPAKGGDDE